MPHELGMKTIFNARIMMNKYYGIAFSNVLASIACKVKLKKAIHYYIKSYIFAKS